MNGKLKSLLHNSNHSYKIFLKFDQNILPTCYVHKNSEDCTQRFFIQDAGIYFVHVCTTFKMVEFSLSLGKTFVKKYIFN